MEQENIFHLAIPITDLSLAKQFYLDGLGCQIGRESKSAIIFNFYSHQLVAHLTTDVLTPQKGIYPRHFGLIFLQFTDWEETLIKAQRQNLNFYQQPKIRFPNSLTEHHTFFLQDPFY
ncbi:MAG: glyoxalase, partial [Cyanobacteria bacterium J083]